MPSSPRKGPAARQIQAIINILRDLGLPMEAARFAANLHALGGSAFGPDIEMAPDGIRRAILQLERAALEYVTVTTSSKPREGVVRGAHPNYYRANYTLTKLADRITEAEITRLAAARDALKKAIE